MSAEDDLQCGMCGSYISAGRWELGYRVCLKCGDKDAERERAMWCIAPMHKSNYTLITNKTDLLGINNKGGLVK